MKRLVLLGAVSLLSRQMLPAADTLSQGEVVRIALRDNAAIKAARAKWEMMKARVPQAGAWEDLRLGVDSVTGRFVNIPPNSFMDQTVMLANILLYHRDLKHVFQYIYLSVLI